MDKQLFINGESHVVAFNATFLEIIRDIGIEDKIMVAAVNGEIIKQVAWESYTPKSGDKIELLQFVGGGSL